jgi:acetylserotonin N-methyltransferase
MASCPRRIAEIAAATGLPEDSAERLLAALCALDIVKKLPDGRFANGREAAEHLVCGRPGYIGALFPHIKHALYPTWQYFKEALYEQAPQWERAFNREVPPNERMYADPLALRHFMEGMHAITYQAAAELAVDAAELSQIDSLVDVGGASGAFVIALAERFASLRGTVLDLPPVKPIAEDFLRKHNVVDRVHFHEADFWEDPIPLGADAYALGFILHDWDCQGGSLLLHKIADATPPGGLLIVGEYLLNDDKTGPLYVVRSDLNMLVAARGRERSALEYGEWLHACGFTLQQIYRTSKGKCFLIARRG